MTGDFKNKAVEAFKDQQARERQKIKAIEKRLGVPQAPKQNNTRNPGKRIDIYYELSRISHSRQQQQQDRRREQAQEQSNEQSKDKGKSL